ncbi:MAG: hypothetical protein QOJ83_1334 [Frankiales bacterium]|jgi:hypothetical protein|nr:hypothetical protein [Frankiales bacterium]
MFGLSLFASVVLSTLIWYRLAVYKEGDAIMVPTLWTGLGPLGQSIAAANLLGGVAHEALRMPYSTALQAFGVVYGMPVWGFALLWVQSPEPSPCVKPRTPTVLADLVVVQSLSAPVSWARPNSPYAPEQTSFT